MRIVVQGLGEAGSLIAADLADHGVEVIGFDPADVATPAGVERASTPTAAVREPADAVLSITAQADAATALIQVLTELPEGTLYADLSTSSPNVKRRLAAVASPTGIRFADVALMTAVPGRGLRTPSLVSGAAADSFVDLMAPLGMPVDAVGPEPGAAATRKLLRSVVMKGLPALVIEALRGADAAGVGPDVWRNLVDELARIDESALRAMLTGIERHAERRFHEMEAVEALLRELGQEPHMSAGTADALEQVSTTGLPQIPDEE